MFRLPQQSAIQTQIPRLGEMSFQLPWRPMLQTPPDTFSSAPGVNRPPMPGQLAESGEVRGMSSKMFPLPGPLPESSSGMSTETFSLTEPHEYLTPPGVSLPSHETETETTYENKYQEWYRLLFENAQDIELSENEITYVLGRKRVETTNNAHHTCRVRSAAIHLERLYANIDCREAKAYLKVFRYLTGYATFEEAYECEAEKRVFTSWGLKPDY